MNFAEMTDDNCISVSHKLSLVIDRSSKTVFVNDMSGLIQAIVASADDWKRLNYCYKAAERLEAIYNRAKRLLERERIEVIQLELQAIMTAAENARQMFHELQWS